MKLFITKNPKNLGSFSGTQLVYLFDRETDKKVATVWTTVNTSRNRYGGTNSWECSYIGLEPGYQVLFQKEGKDSLFAQTCRLWNKENPKQALHSPMWGGEYETAYIVDSDFHYVDVYAEKALGFRWLSAAKSGLLRQQWGGKVEDITILDKQVGTHLPSALAEDGRAIVYSRRGQQEVAAFWDEGDHVMEYHLLEEGKDTRLCTMAFGLYTVFTDADKLWAAVDDYNRKLEEIDAAEAPVDPECLSRPRRVRRPKPETL
jgi:hypothetical protein